MPRIAIGAVLFAGVVLASTLTTAAASAQRARAWVARDQGGPGLKDLASTAWDPVAKRVILFGGRDGATGTFAWSGARWQRVSADAGPVGYDFAAATDEARGVVLAFGGTQADDTAAKTFRTLYQWDGVAWKQLTPTTMPPARRGGTMAYHPVRKTVILVGGRDNSGRSATDTWEWDGTNWKALTGGITTGFKPAVLAFDRKAGELVHLYDGVTRVFDGAAWQERATGGPRDATAMGWDAKANRLVAQEFTDTSTTTWAWSGTKWDVLTTSGVAPGRPKTRELVWDESSMSLVMFAYAATPGMGVFDYAPEATYRLDGTTWLRATDVIPPARTEPGVAYDEARKRLVMFGGNRYSTELNDTWEWDGERWNAIATTSAPQSRTNPAMAWDPSRNAIVLYGGAHEGGSAIGGTWTYDGKTWTELVPETGTTAPPARTNTALAFDGVGVVMFGGYTSSTYLSDTYRLSGSTWTKLSPATSPPGRSEYAMAYDAQRKKVVLYSGRNTSSGSSISDTWEWDGASWAALPSVGPGPRLKHAMAWMPPLRATLVYGASSSGNPNPFEWTGLAWESVTLRGTEKPEGTSVELAWDSSRNRAVAISANAGVWEYIAIGNACTAASECGSGHCVDGVCCDRACGGGVAGDCLACSVAKGGIEDGVCGPLADKDAACTPVSDAGVDSDGGVNGGVNGPGADGGSSDGGCGCSAVPSTVSALPFASVVLALLARVRRSRRR